MAEEVAEQLPSSPWRIVGITALVSTGSTMPVMLFVAPVAGVFGALAATIFGVPIVAMARHWHRSKAWQAAVLGLFAAVSAGGVFGYLSGVMAFADQPTPRGYVIGMVWQCSVIAAPFGPAAALVYWARYVSKGWASREVVPLAVGLMFVTAMIFAANHEIR